MIIRNICLLNAWQNLISVARFGYDNSVSLQTTSTGHLGAPVLAHVATRSGLQTNDAPRNRKGLRLLVV